MTEPWWAGAPPNPLGSPPQQARGQTAPWAPPPGVTPSGRPPASPGRVTVPGQSLPGQPVPSRPSTYTSAPGAPAQPISGASQPPPPTTPARAGLGILIFLLVVATFAAGWWVFGPPALAWATAIEPCLDGGGAYECVVNDDWRNSVMLPLVAMLGALCLARGAGIERRQGRSGYGFLYALLGFAALAAAWAVGAS